MNVLFDTSAFLVAHTQPSRLGRHRDVLEDPGTIRLMSAVVGWEIAIKHRLGKLELPAPPDRWVPKMAEAGAMTPLPVLLAHALAVAALPDHHQDPFDRLLVVTARALDVPILTSDRIFKRYGVEVLMF